MANDHVEMAFVHRQADRPPPGATAVVEERGHGGPTGEALEVGRGCVARAAPEGAHAARPGDTPAVAAWRVRMGTPAAREIYKKRAATAECINALARNRGLQRFTVRGLVKAKAVALLFALAHNLMRAHSLSAATA